MDLISYLDEFGNRALAQALGVTPSLISQWKTGRRNVSPESAIRIERATNSTVTRAELRPDIFGPPGESRDQGAA
ncbi:helix-turn-helix domain-containing protein [Acidithiobacillus ferrooxidans]|nr:helix-turn-helix domain-containing protein [Acidithiobacillus ferrooxidans]MBU2861901.1 helix-turn-helix domain-containing protein [Acidithiobacillus ferrooxidans]